MTCYITGNNEPVYIFDTLGHDISFYIHMFSVSLHLVHTGTLWQQHTACHSHITGACDRGSDAQLEGWVL